MQIFRSTKCLTVFLVIILNTEARRHREYIFKFSEDTEKLNSVVIYKTQRHRGTEDIFLSYKKIQRNLNSVFNTKTQRDKVFSRYKDNKRLKSRHKALRQRKPPAPLIPRGGTCIAADNSVSSVKAALAALCIFRTRKNLSVSVSLCSKKHLAAENFVAFVKQL